MSIRALHHWPLHSQTPKTDSPGRTARTPQKDSFARKRFGRLGRVPDGRRNPSVGRLKPSFGRPPRTPPKQKVRFAKKDARPVLFRFPHSRSIVGSTALHSGGIRSSLEPLRYLIASPAAASCHRSPHSRLAYIERIVQDVSTLFGPPTCQDPMTPRHAPLDSDPVCLATAGMGSRVSPRASSLMCRMCRAKFQV